MKRVAAVLLAAVLVLSLAACGGQTNQESSGAAPETLTGTAEGYGGNVTVTLTRENGKITACTIEGKDETESIGGAALPTLQDQVVAANGFEIDGVSGATVTSKAVKKATAAALGQEYKEEAPAPVEAAKPAEIVPIEGGIQLGLAYGAAHGTKCFTEAYAVVKDDVIVAAFIDEFQFVATDAGLTTVPNSDSDFAAGYAEGQALASKRAIADYYSKNMAEKGGSTISLLDNFKAIQDYVVGKTIAEIEGMTSDKEAAVDAVSGATLVDTAGYLGVIAEAAKNAQKTQAVEFTGDSSALKLNVAYSAAHGTKCFTAAAAVTANDKIVLSYIDEFQFVATDAGLKTVPNSDTDFAAGYAEGQAMASKREVADYYSKNMAEKGGATIRIDDNFNAIQNHVNGMSISDVQALANTENPVDAVSGATLVDTAGYLKAILAATKPVGVVPIEGGIQLGMAYGAAHGTKCFTEAFAVVKDDVIVAAFIDEFQFVAKDAGLTTVPNSDDKFGENYAEGQAMASKRAIADYYSKNMAEKGGSTISLMDNFKAIENYVVGKTIAEVEGMTSDKEAAVDAVSGATLVDTAGYLGVIAKAAKNAQNTQAVEFTGDSSALKLKAAYGAANGNNCFTPTAVVLDGDKIVLTYFDEFQFFTTETGLEAVPNSDADFGKDGFAEGMALSSKRVVADYYSNLMTQISGATVRIDDNFNAIQNHVNGMTISEVKALAEKENPVDAISGATLVNTTGYLESILLAANS